MDRFYKLEKFSEMCHPYERGMTEVRYDDEAEGFVDEIVADQFHLEMMSDVGCWFSINGLDCNIFIKNRKLIVRCEKSEAVEIENPFGPVVRESEQRIGKLEARP